MKLTIVSAKSKIHSPRRGYLSPGNSIVLEIETALLFISVTNSCRFGGSFVEIHACFQQTCLFSCFTQLFSGAAVKCFSSHLTHRRLPFLYFSYRYNFFLKKSGAKIQNCVDKLQEKQDTFAVQFGDHLRSWDHLRTRTVL